VIARFGWDSHFPGAVWAQALREADGGELARVAARLPQVEADLLGKLGLRA
jgi:diadenosine tetraphosphate (Ap4A) HIT family hydrolase